MTNRSRLFAAAVGALSLGATAAWATETTQVDSKIQQLEAKVAALEAKQAQNSKDLAATVDAVLRDAEKRSQLLAAGAEMGAGYDNGFYIRAGDSWVFRPSVLFQFWNVTDFRQDVPSGGDSKDEWDNGFEVHRLQLAFEGTAFTKDLTYAFRWQSSSDGGGFSLLDANARYMFADDWGVRMGQFLDPISNEQNMSDGMLLAAERSLADLALGGGVVGRVQGVSLVYGAYNKNNPINAEVVFHDGMQSANTAFTKADDVSDWGITGRVEWKAMGNWSDYADFTAKGAKEDLLVLGLGADWSQAGDGNIVVAVLDGQWETASGFGVYGAGFLNYRDAEALPGAAENATDWALLAQAGYMLNPNWEIFGRYDYIGYDDEALAGADQDHFQEVAFGVNYYMGADGAAKHRAKFTVDLVWLPDGIPASVVPGSIGAQDDNPGNNEFMLRAQFQLMI